MSLIQLSAAIHRSNMYNNTSMLVWGNEDLSEALVCKFNIVGKCRAVSSGLYLMLMNSTVLQLGSRFLIYFIIFELILIFLLAKFQAFCNIVLTF